MLETIKVYIYLWVRQVKKISQGWCTHFFNIRLLTFRREEKISGSFISYPLEVKSALQRKST
jgi:hypothetical protein